jgi:hypothetical protein
VWLTGPGGKFQLNKYMGKHALINWLKVPARRSPVFGLAFDLEKWAGEVLQLEGKAKIE